MGIDLRMLLRSVLAVAAIFIALAGAAAAEGDGVQFSVPYRSQFDGDPYEGGNCGPATMGMILAAYGKHVPTKELRRIVNDLQRTWGMYDEGTLIENLAVIANRFGLRPLELFEGSRLRRWTLDDVRWHLQSGHPVVPQVWYRGLPGRETRAYNGDHYIALTGYEGDEFIYSDSVDTDGPGSNRRISAAKLDKAWRNSDFPFAALAVAGSDSRHSLLTTPTAVPTQTPTATATATATAVASATATITPPPAVTATQFASITPEPPPARPNPVRVTEMGATPEHSVVFGGGLIWLLGIGLVATVWWRRR